jgi:amino acid adenylation domain-containing protein
MTPLPEASPRTEQPLHAGLLRSAELFPDRPALEVGGSSYTYAELAERAASIAATLQARAPDDGPPLTAVFAYRSVTAFAGLLGALMRGHGYVPLNVRFPIPRTRAMLAAAGCRAIVADAESAAQLEEVTAAATEPLLVLLPDEDDVSELAGRLPGHTVLGARDLVPADDWEAPAADPDALAYLLFTSGSTGVPKGVMIRHRNVNTYVGELVQRYAVTEEDRFSQTAELTFDNSVLDVFVPWERGACVCCPSRKELISPGAFIRGSRLTVWFSVPSTAIFMKRFRALKPDRYPTLRWSLFAGEALPVEVAESWLVAAPNSTVENLYGPTEVTDVCVIYRWDPATSHADCEMGVVPIGHPLGAMSCRVVDADLNEVVPGEIGELLVSGPQVGAGYWNDPERTARTFIVPPGSDAVHYRTGDRVRRPARNGGPVMYLGRIDNQVQILGERIELGEIEAALREESGTDAVVALGWPVNATGAEAIEAFVGDPGVDVTHMRTRLEARLPTQAVPRRIHALPELPLNSNGKFDRNALTRFLEDRA